MVAFGWKFRPMSKTLQQNQQYGGMTYDEAQEVRHVTTGEIQ